MIFHQGEAIYYTQKHISNGSVWRDAGLGQVDRIYFLESLTKTVAQSGCWHLPRGCFGGLCETRNVQ